MMKKALVTDYVHPLLISGLEERGYNVDYDTSVNMDILPSIIHKYELAVINSKIRLFQETIDKALHLKFICRLGSGLEIIDLNYASEKNIHVINTPSGNNNAVAEHAMGMLLALANNLLRSDREVRDFQWNRELNRGWELKGKTIGIIGFGHTGSQFAKKILALLATKYTVPIFFYFSMENKFSIRERIDGVFYFYVSVFFNTLPGITTQY